MFRTIRRWFSDRETQTLAEEVERLKEVFLVHGHKLDWCEQRLERHLNKLRMRDTRLNRSSGLGLTEEELAMVAEMRENGGRVYERDPFVQ